MYGMLAIIGLLLIACEEKEPEYITPETPSVENVKLEEGPWHEAMELKKQEYLLTMDTDRLLHHFRKVAGIPTDTEEYGGWEERELRGHTIGHYLTAVSLKYELTGDTALYNRGEYIVEELRKCQEEIGTGYLSAFPTEFLDRVENKDPVWAPYYTLHKILAGLFDFYIYGEKDLALETALDFTHYLYDRIAPLGREHFQEVLDNTEQGGMNEVFWNIYEETGDTISRALAEAFYQESYYDPLAERRDHLKGYHSNSFIPTVVGVAREYEITGDITRKQISEFFWNQVVDARSYVTGGTSNGEHWNSEPYHMHTELGASAHESCCTYNMIKLSDRIWDWSHDVKYQEYMERALVNGILPTINRETGSSMYYVSMAPGYYKTWDTPENSFWCCTGTGLENFGRIADYIYGVKDDRLYVNQFVSSSLNYEEHGFTLVQNTSLPDGNNVNIEVEAGSSTPLKLAVRIPSWSGDNYEATINGEEISPKPAPGSYMLIDRVWQDGDVLDITFTPQSWYSLLPVTNEYVAFGYGPLVLTAKFEEAEVGEDMRHQYGPYDGEPIDVPEIRFNTENFEDYIEVVDLENRHFTVTSKEGNKIDLVPFYDIHKEYFSVYLPVDLGESTISVSEE